jgi:hypothetical protein
MTTAANEVETAKLGRPPVPIDVENLRRLAALQHTLEELAFFFQCSKRTMIRRLKEPQLRAAYQDGLAGGKAALRRLQWRHAQMPNSAGVNMAIHLSKHWLGETDKSALELTGRVDANLKITTAKQRVTRKIEDLAARLQSRMGGVALAAGAPQVSGDPVG